MNNQKSYSEKLRDPRWQRKRLEILSRDNFQCKNCFDKEKTLHVHHLTYKKGAMPWEYEDSWLTTLCEDCHSELTDALPQYEKALLHAYKLKCKNLFTLDAFVNMISSCKDFDNLIFLLYTLSESQAIAALRYQFNVMGTEDEIKEIGHSQADQ